MNRHTDIDQQFVETARAQLVAHADGGGDDAFEPADRKNRAAVASYQDDNGDWHESALKRDDDIMWCGGIPSRVIGPARGRDWLSVCYTPWMPGEVLTIHLSYIDDRAPVDPQEPTPYMPLIPEPEQPMMMMRSALEPGSTENPKKAAQGERRETRDQLREMLARLEPEQQKRVRKALRDNGVLKGDDKDAG